MCNGIVSTYTLWIISFCCWTCLTLRGEVQGKFNQICLIIFKEMWIQATVCTAVMSRTLGVLFNSHICYTLKLSDMTLLNQSTLTFVTVSLHSRFRWLSCSPCSVLLAFVYIHYSILCRDLLAWIFSLERWLASHKTPNLEDQGLCQVCSLR
jgi:hypothetical protein